MKCTKPVWINNKPPLSGGLYVPCGKCIASRIQKRNELTMRCLHELSYHDSSSFVTLTYNDDSLPDNSSLRKRDLQLFFKRLRKAVLPVRIRYFACGEYGDNSHRPQHTVYYHVRQHQTHVVR